MEATSHEAERAIRPGVVNRKSRGGNLTRHGARTRQVLLSPLRTASQQARDPVEVIVSLPVRENPGVADLAIPVPRPQRPALPAARSP
ncbi:MAG: hypothetical protein ACRDJF_02100 [Actinomycetota bacterium]